MEIIKNYLKELLSDSFDEEKIRNFKTKSVINRLS